VAWRKTVVDNNSPFKRKRIRDNKCEWIKNSFIYHKKHTWVKKQFDEFLENEFKFIAGEAMFELVKKEETKMKNSK